MASEPLEAAPPRQPDAPRRVAGEAAQAYAALPGVLAVALAGSQTTATADVHSDLDLYVYSQAPLDVAERARIAQERSRADALEVDNRFWEPGDEWLEAATGLQVDVMFRTRDWIEDQLARVLDRHQPSHGYSTSIWHNVLVSEALADRGGWFGGLQARARQPYPEALAMAIIDHNWPLLRGALDAYPHQLARAAARADLVSLNHRIAALLASYFDVLFALNRTPHPGEKRLVALAAALPRTPHHLAADVQALLEAGVNAPERVVTAAEHLIDGLAALLGA